MLPRVRARLQSPAVPELPDLAILADALDHALAGRPMIGAKVQQTLVLRGTPAELAAFDGQVLNSVRRRGKFLVFDFGRDRIVFNPMLTGRLGLALAGAKPWPQWAAAFEFGPAIAARKRRKGAWPGDADWLPRRDLGVELRYRDATRMGKIYLAPAGVGRPIAGWDEQGPDADDPSLTLEEWRARIGRYTGELKNLLRNQAFVAGIGNAYSDEILHRARLSPLKQTAGLTDVEIDRLRDASLAVLGEWTERLRAEARDAFPEKVTAFRPQMAVHGRYGNPCPVCGTAIQRISYAQNEADYCPRCQTEGRILADRALSRLLKADWPRTIEELEERRST